MFLTCEYCGKEFHGVEVFEEALEHEKNCPVALKEKLYDLIDEANALWQAKQEYLTNIKELDEDIAKTNNKAVDISDKVGYELDVDENGVLYIKSYEKYSKMDKTLKDLAVDCRKCEGVCGKQDCCKDCTLTEGWDKDNEDNQSQDTLFTTKGGFSGTLKDGKLKLTPLKEDEIDEILKGIKTVDLDSMAKEIANSLKSEDSLDKIRKMWKEILE